MARSRAINNDCLPRLLRLLGLSDDSSGMSDVVFVAIDFENPQSVWEKTSSKVGCQVGIAVLDTKQLEKRRLATASSCEDDEQWNGSMKEAEELITTYNFAAGPVKYCESGRIKNRFLFGKTTLTDSSDMREKVESCIPQNREIILVGHNLHSDLKALESLELNFKTYAPWNAIDTSIIGRQMFTPKSKNSLRGILRRLKCPYVALHCAGNDANFTLRAMLLLAARACHQNHLEMSRFLAKIATTSSYYFGQQDHPMVKEWELRKKVNEELREIREYLQNVRRIARAQRAVTGEAQDEGNFLEEGDLSRLEASCHDQGRAVAELQNKDDALEEGDLRWVEVPWHDRGRDCISRPWGLEWVMMHDQA